MKGTPIITFMYVLCNLNICLFYLIYVFSLKNSCRSEYFTKIGLFLIVALDKVKVTSLLHVNLIRQKKKQSY